MLGLVTRDCYTYSVDSRNDIFYLVSRKQKIQEFFYLFAVLLHWYTSKSVECISVFQVYFIQYQLLYQLYYCINYIIHYCINYIIVTPSGTYMTFTMSLLRPSDIF